MATFHTKKIIYLALRRHSFKIAVAGFQKFKVQLMKLTTFPWYLVKLNQIIIFHPSLFPIETRAFVSALSNRLGELRYSAGEEFFCSLRHCPCLWSCVCTCRWTLSSSKTQALPRRIQGQISLVQRICSQWDLWIRACSMNPKRIHPPRWCRSQPFVSIAWLPPSWPCPWAYVWLMRRGKPRRGYPPCN